MRIQKGFGLLEILITLVLLGVGVAGLVALARNMLVASQEGRRYEVAMRLAESKLDEFRNFQGVASLPSGATGTLYKDIMPSSTPQTVLNDYYVSWTVSNEYLNSGTWSTTNSAGVPYPDRKLVEVTVNWNGGRPLKLAGAISPTGSLTPNNLGSLLTPRENPEVDYAKGKVPDVVSVELGDGNSKETSKPLPHIQGGSSTSRTVQFETATYQTLNNTNPDQAKAMQDTATVYCSCTFAGGMSNVDNPAYLPSVPYYDQTHNVQYWKAGAQVPNAQVSTNKPIGALNGNANNQEALCPACCREHYDVSSSTQFSDYYDPLNKGRTAGKSNGDYPDACRFIRIDGVYRPAPDWHLISLTVFPSKFLKNQTNLGFYQTYIAYVVKKYVYGQYSNSVASTAIPQFIDWLKAQANSETTIAALSASTSTAIQLMSRGIYVDILPPEYLLKEVYGGDVPTGPEPANLAKIPFQDINLTLLSDWGVNNSSMGTVTSEEIETINDPANQYYGTYSRGVLLVNPNSNGDIIVSATSNQGNSGVVGAPKLQHEIGAALSASVSINISTQALPDEFLFDVQCSQLKANGNSAENCDSSIEPVITAVPSSVTCDRVSTPGGASKGIYSCQGIAGLSQITLNFSYTKTTGDSRTFIITPSSKAIPLPWTTQRPCVMMVETALKDQKQNTPLTCSPPL